jgi:class II lanthipeptide synthase
VGLKDRALDVAGGIGRRLTETAVWHERRCNWVGVRPGWNSRAPVRASLGPDLYAGSSGVALFLAELCRATGETHVRRTTLGAIEQALSSVGNEGSADGLYRGRIGVAVAAARVGTLLQEQSLLERAAAILAQSRPPDTADDGFDLLSGRAGGIIGHLIMYAILGDRGHVDKALMLADQLCNTNMHDDCWSPPSADKSSPLTGFAHGSAGVGYALMALFGATGASRHRHAADIAFAYERSVFDEAKLNWPDFRKQRTGGNPHGASTLATEWCHGAAGIALSRLHAYHLVGDQTCLAEALAGITTTRHVVTARLRNHSGNYCLCHGLAGNAEVLLHAHEILGSSSTQDLAIANHVAEDGMARFAGNQLWPCGVRGGMSYDLMTGLAGIGHFYLRLYDRTVPSAVLLRPESFSGKTGPAQ